MILQDAQEFRLCRRTHLTDFVEEECAALRLLKSSGFGLLRIGEGAALIAEQFRFEELLGDAGTIEGHEGAFGSGACCMDALGHEFFAGAAFAGDKDGRRIGLGDFGCQMFQEFHLRRSADELVECGWTISLSVGLWRFEDTGLVDGGLEILYRDWLRKIVGGATVQRFDRGFCRPVCSEDDDARRRLRKDSS